MVIINNTGLIGHIIMEASTNITGSIFLTLLMIFILIGSILLIFRADFTLISIVLFPLIIVFSVLDPIFLTVASGFLMIVAIIFASNFILNR